MIKHLVPEANVSEHHILREDEEDEGMRSNASGKTEMSIEDVVVKGEKSDRSEVDNSEAENATPVAVETMAPPVAENDDMIATHQFSPAWIEEEALELLRTIQQPGLIGKTVGQSMVLLAGYGFGGIVVKQVLSDLSRHGCKSRFLSFSRLSSSPIQLPSTTISP